MMTLGNRWLYTGDRLPLSEQIERIRRVGVADVRRVIERYPFASRTVVRLTPAVQRA